LPAIIDLERKKKKRQKDSGNESGNGESGNIDSNSRANQSGDAASTILPGSAERTCD
jgi:hypothetical protein